MSEQQSQLKKVKEIFSDYKTRANILEAKILGLNLLKKKRILELILSSDEYIEIKEIWYLEKYLRERFLFENIEKMDIQAERRNTQRERERAEAAEKRAEAASM